MTNEEALAILDTIPTIGEQVDALEMAIDALKHPRQQCIAKIELPKEELEKIFQKVLHESKQALPLERKTGKWIPATPLPMEADSYKHKRYWKCSVCGGHDFFNPQYSEKIKFCRYCGAELEVDE